MHKKTALIVAYYIYRLSYMHAAFSNLTILSLISIANPPPLYNL
jgi:hypothetical protein